jgi:predicted ATPase
MNKYNKGSLWRRWDLQVQPIQNKWLTDPESNHNKIKKSCGEYIKSAINKNISVLGITDHNTGYAIDLCVEICQKDKNNVIILPGVELDTSEGWHLLVFFSDEYKTKLKCDSWKEVIETFLQNICNISKPFYKNRDTSKKIGMTTIELLQKIKNEKIGITIFAHCHAEAGFFKRGDTSGRLDIIKAHSCNEVDFLFEIKDDYTQLEKIRKKLTGWGYDPKKIGILSSSDAHNASNVGDCFSWIKADPTFNGLKQALYEPNERVVIQEDNPEKKPSYQVIDKIEIGYPDIENDVIELNTGLNCIIGGRSTGKSVLLSSIAKKLKDAAKAKENNPKYERFIEPITKSLKLIWKDGIEDDEREIEFFNQGYMNEYSREENQEKFDNLVREILKEKANGNLFEEFDDFVERNKTTIQAEVNHIYNFLSKIIDRKQEVKDIGDIKGIELEIQKLEAEILSSQKVQKISEEDYQNFQKQKEVISTKENQKNDLNNDLENIKKITRELKIQPLPSYWNELSELTKRGIENLYKIVEQHFHVEWNEGASVITLDISSKINTLTKEQDALKKGEIYLSGIKLMEQNNVLKNLENRLTDEKNKKNKITQLIGEVSRLEKNVATTKANIIKKHKQFYIEADRIASKLSTSLADKSLEIRAYPRFLENEYNRLLEQAINLQGNDRKKLASFVHEGNESYEKEFCDKLDKLLENRILLVQNFSSRKLIERILPESNYTISYEVTYENDKYSEMSEGKQAFVVLKLLLDFSDRKCPIFIDQPEDDLDNRAIYNDLVKYLRTKKKERQIIVVTHNPNIVVGTDAELVFVANQHGVNNKNTQNKRFQYVAGSIEHTIPSDEKKTIVLEKQGIREHICEILEGGEYAFKMREKRYDIKG